MSVHPVAPLVIHPSIRIFTDSPDSTTPTLPAALPRPATSPRPHQTQKSVRVRAQPTKTMMRPETDPTRRGGAIRHLLPFLLPFLCACSRLRVGEQVLRSWSWLWGSAEVRGVRNGEGEKNSETPRRDGERERKKKHRKKRPSHLLVRVQLAEPVGELPDALRLELVARLVLEGQKLLW